MPTMTVWVLTTALLWSVQWSDVTGEGHIDPLTSSLCRLREECTQKVNVEDLEHDELGTPQAICVDFMELLEKHDVDCETLEDPGVKPADVERTLELQYTDKEREQPPTSEKGKENNGDLGYKPHPIDNPGQQFSGNDQERMNQYQDCSHIYTAGSTTNGVYFIKPVNVRDKLSVYCDQTTDGGGWTVIQRRFNGSLEFYRFIDAYRDGFGNSSGEYWLGLDNIHHITAQTSYELYIELKDWQGNVKYAKYSTFSVGPGNNYTLAIDGYSGTAGNGMDLNSGLNFTARGSDPEAILDISMAQFYGGGWWYFWLGSHSNLNGPYFRDTDGFNSDSGNGPGVLWSPFHDNVYYSLKETKMMVRPKG
ncbi:PREDICTED: fibrinogen C domain-containing protein 1-like [Branchiostoma belcheri]|uniref:Fibrinogen C domain-containing protein 1-like n=1 Tax=Branchiostoma belcheri TaxID=7741 RepID=A0A6P4YUD0_BRABE|nr:PREDICTED: fibrinogen C domain-containing protein 1-like [Branchiostoma belcheri]